MPKLRTGTTCSTPMIGARTGGSSKPPPNPVMPLQVPATKAASAITRKSNAATSASANCMHYASHPGPVTSRRGAFPPADIPGAADRDRDEEHRHREHPAGDRVGDESAVVVVGHQEGAAET